MLVVENHLETRQSVALLLRVFGYRPSGVANVAAALALIEGTHFDVLLSDLRLPDGDGCDLLRQLEARRRRPAHAIAMSGLGGPVDHRRSQEAGFATLLVKPFTPEDLEGALRCDRVSVVSAAPPAPASVAGGDGVLPVQWAQRMHDGLCQHLAAAALWQGVLIRRLETMSQMVPVTALAAEDAGTAGAPVYGALEDAMTDAEQVGRLLDDALSETRALMRAMRTGE